ncbi:MAG TPA: hypothetical protein PKD55_22290 [Bellilinea sp.]|jgi:hypothetical protein|nr:hypothetical protein [Bellilinea sp.]
MSSRHISQLLSQELTRKQFLLYLGFLVLTLTGITGLAKTLSDPKLIHKQSAATRGFGSGPYGG